MITSCCCPSYYAKEEQALAELCPIHGHAEFLLPWKMRDGTRIAVADMTTEHIRNSKAMLLRIGQEQSPMVEIFSRELRRRGE